VPARQIKQAEPVVPFARPRLDFRIREPNSTHRDLGTAVAIRLTMTESAGATGSNVRYVDQMLRFGKRAFWPSQSAAIEGGLLDRGHPSMAIKMPTSAGKTTLIELVAADALDAEGDSVAVVLAPTKALVRQLSGDLHKALPARVAVRSSHGGLDFDVEGPSSYGLMTETGVVVVTPERFDLEWRQAVSNSNAAVVDRVRLLVVDEAHLITEMGRGPRLELRVTGE
jgi:replicative superfamily II helicase